MFLAKFYWPSELPGYFWQLLVQYVALQAVYLYCYYEAIAIADISYVAPLMTLFSVGNLIGAYLILHQTPSIFGVIGALFIMLGAYIIARAKRRQTDASNARRKAFILVMIAIIVCSWFSNIEVKMLRMSNPTSYNFYTSLFTVPFVILVTLLVLKSRRRNIKLY